MADDPKPINVHSVAPVPVYYGVRGDTGEAVGYPGHVHLWRERERAEAYCRPENRKPTRINCGLFLSAAAWGRVQNLLRLVDGDLRNGAQSALTELDSTFAGPFDLNPPTEIERHVGGLFVPDSRWEEMRELCRTIAAHAKNGRQRADHYDMLGLIGDDARQLAAILNPETPDE